MTSAVRRTSGYLNVHDFGATGDGVADDAPAFAAAIAAANSRAFPGGTIVQQSNARYRFGSPVVVAGSGLRFIGDPSSHIFATDTVAAAFRNSGLASSNVVFEDMTFVGGVDDPGPGAAVTRTKTFVAGLENALTFTGTSWSDVTARGCKFLRLRNLPVFFDGATEGVEVVESRFEACLDPGFVFCNEARFVGNSVYRGSDNGVSISRQCKNAVVSDNFVKDCARVGIWVSGWQATTGLASATVTGNVVEGCGGGGIRFADGWRNGSATGNVVRGMTRGASDEINISGGYGLRLAGGIGEIRNVVVSDNTFDECERGGMLIEANVFDSMVANNIVSDAGTDTLPDGSAIPASALNQNFGIRFQDPVERVQVYRNHFTDARATPYGIWPISVPTNNPSGVMDDNTTHGYSQPLVQA